MSYLDKIQERWSQATNGAWHIFRGDTFATIADVEWLLFEHRRLSARVEELEAQCKLAEQRAQDWEEAAMPADATLALVRRVRELEEAGRAYFAISDSPYVPGWGPRQKRRLSTASAPCWREPHDPPIPSLPDRALRPLGCGVQRTR